jgi:hypothetical protein
VSARATKSARNLSDSGRFVLVAGDRNDTEYPGGFGDEFEVAFPLAA